MSRRGVPAYHDDPRVRAVAKLLIDLELVAEGGRETMRIANRCVFAVADAGEAQENVAEVLDAEQLVTAGGERAQDAARQIVDKVMFGDES